jgi:hypothetical protein
VLRRSALCAATTSKLSLPAIGAGRRYGVFLCLEEFDASFFLGMNNTGGPVDVWTVEGIGED